VPRAGADGKAQSLHLSQDRVLAGVADARPVKAEFYLTSGKHIKSAMFDEYGPVAGTTRLVRMTLYDQLRKQSHSVMRFSDFQPREVPDKLFHQGSGRF